MHPLDNARYTELVTLGELDAIRIRHPSLEVTLVMQGAHLVHFAPAGDMNWLWLSPSARFSRGVAIRGGIPVCWPWFGDPARNPEAVSSLVDTSTAHGFARTVPWVLDHLEELEETVAVRLALDVTDDRAGYPWRGRARVSLTFRFSPEGFTLALTTLNTGPEALPLSQALHTYLPTPEVSETGIHGFDGSRYLDTLDGWRTDIQQGPVQFRGETDRIYLSAPPLAVQTPQQHYRLTSEGSQSTIVWNPGPDKAARLSDFPDDAWSGMLCVETANAAEDYRTLAPEGSHTLAMTLTRI